MFLVKIDYIIIELRVMLRATLDGSGLRIVVSTTIKFIHRVHPMPHRNQKLYIIANQ